MNERLNGQSVRFYEIEIVPARGERDSANKNKQDQK